MTLPDIITPRDIRAMRARIGLESMQHASELFDMKISSYERIERAGFEHAWRGIAEELHKIEVEFEATRDRMSEAAPPAVLIDFRSQRDFETYEPELAKKLIFRAVHERLIAEVQGDFAAGGLLVNIVGMVPNLYDRWRGDQPDTKHLRQLWGHQRLQDIRQHDGMPSKEVTYA